MTVSPHEFLRRFLLHVLPAGFVKIRHFGLFGARQVPTALAHARRLLAGAPPRTTPPPPAPRDWRTLLRRLTGVDLARCPRCAHGTMIRRPLLRIPPALSPSVHHHARLRDGDPTHAFAGHREPFRSAVLHLRLDAFAESCGSDFVKFRQARGAAAWS